MSDSNTFSIDGIDDPVVFEMLQGIASNLVNNTTHDINVPEGFTITNEPMHQNVIDATSCSLTVDTETIDISTNKFYKEIDTFNTFYKEIDTFNTTCDTTIPETIAYEDISVFDTFINKHTSALSSIENSIEFNMDDKVSIKNNSDLNIHVIVVGCGGTGSRLVALLAQQMSTRSNIALTLYDADACEHKNLSRQNFFEFEVGENKAEALAERYNMLYGIDIHPITEKFDESRLNRKLNYDTFIFDCTDNKDARKSIQNYSLEVARRGFGLYIISCGNEKDYGQVHFASTKDNKILGNDDAFSLFKGLSKNINNSYQNVANVVYSLAYLNNNDVYLPEFLYYNKTFKDNTESTSCVNMDIAEEQSMAINSTIAQIAFNMFYQWLVSRDGLTNMIVHANLSNTFVGQKVNTIDGLLDIYIRSIFGKGIFFEKETCKASLLNVCSDYVKITKEKYVNELIGKNTNINIYKKSVIYEKYNSDVHYMNDGCREYYSNYFNNEFSKIIEYIDTNYNSTKDNSYYLEILFLIDCYVQHLIAFRNCINMICIDKYYNKSRFNSAIMTHIDKLSVYFKEKYENFGGSYKFFEEEN